MDYTSVLLVKQTLPQIGSVTSVTSADIARVIQAAESIVNGKLAKAYTIPITPIPPLLETIATDITLYRLLALRFYSQEQMNSSVWPDKFKEALAFLEQIADGEITLVSSAGTAIGASVGATEFKSTSLLHQTTFTEDNMINSEIDTDKIDGIRAVR